MKRIIVSFIAALALPVAGNAAVLYSTNFETTPTGVTVVTSSADTEVDLNFNYGTYVPTAPTAPITSITLAPNSTAGQTRGLKMRANFDATGTNEVATVYFTASTGLTSWTLQFDCFQMVNGAPPMTSGVGTTTGFCVGNAVLGGATAANAGMYTGATTFNGWFLLVTGEGGQGASGDARYYSSAGGAPAVSLTIPNWALNGGTTLNTNMGVDASWDAVFPDPVAEDGIRGLPGRRWVTWTLQEDVVGQMTVFMQLHGAAKQQVAKWNQPSGNTIGLGFDDFNTGSVAVPPQDNFVVIDNLSISTATPLASAATDWQYLQ